MKATEPTPQEYIIGLAKRAKEGKVSNVMFSKYYEYAFNWFSFEASNLKGIECISYTILFGMSVIQAATILATPKPRKPLPKCMSGCVHGEKEIIINCCQASVQYAPNFLGMGNVYFCNKCDKPCKPKQKDK